MCSISFSDKETSLKSYSICQYVSGSNVDLLINIFNLPTDTINWINVGGGGATSLHTPLATLLQTCYDNTNTLAVSDMHLWSFFMHVVKFRMCKRLRTNIAALNLKRARI